MALLYFYYYAFYASTRLDWQERHYVLNLSVHYQTCEHDMLKTNELISMQISTGQGHETVNFLCQEVKGRGDSDAIDRFGGLV